MLTRELEGGLDLLALHRAWPERYPFLVESLAAHPKTARYDIAFAFPGAAIEAPSAAPADRAGFFERFSAAHAATAVPPQSTLPFVGGWFFMLGYELAQRLEPRLNLPPSPFAGGGLPEAFAVRCPAAVVVDRERKRCLLIAEEDHGQIEQMLRDCAAARAVPALAETDCLSSLTEEPPERFLAAVKRTLDYLRAGDIFQANISRLWQGELSATITHACVYERLRRHNPAPFAGLAHWRGHSVLSSSPERLIEVADGVVRTRPIAGTRARGASEEEDAAARAVLLANIKERAEHIMLIDLERNDLGRIAIPGTVDVSELMALESYAHVHHLVSEVVGRLQPDLTALDALQAVFPGGTITGCPKIRSMEIIAELERDGRGPSYGSMGYWSRCGRLDSNILIRTLVCSGRRIAFRTGSGIVADSDPQAELAETRAKARGLLLALGAAGAA